MSFKGNENIILGPGLGGIICGKGLSNPCLTLFDKR